MLTLFVIMTLENFPQYMEEATQVHPQAWIFFVTYVLVASFLVINVLIAIIINSVEEARRDEALESMLAARQDLDKDLDEAGASFNARERAALRVHALREALEELENELGTADEAQAIAARARPRAKGGSSPGRALGLAPRRPAYSRASRPRPSRTGVLVQVGDLVAEVLDVVLEDRDLLVGRVLVRGRLGDVGLELGEALGQRLHVFLGRLGGGVLDARDLLAHLVDVGGLGGLLVELDHEHERDGGGRQGDDDGGRARVGADADAPVELGEPGALALEPLVDRRLRRRQRRLGAGRRLRGRLGRLGGLPGRLGAPGAGLRPAGRRVPGAGASSPPALPLLRPNLAIAPGLYCSSFWPCSPHAVSPPARLWASKPDMRKASAATAERLPTEQTNTTAPLAVDRLRGRGQAVHLHVPGARDPLLGPFLVGAHVHDLDVAGLDPGGEVGDADLD